jgi:GTP-binding protein HflX
MSKNKLITINSEVESAFLIGVEFHNHPNILPLLDSLNELTLLAQTAGLKVVGQSTQKLDKPNPATFIGSGKVEEIKILAEEAQSNIILFDDELSPRHIRELEEKFGNRIRILDRTALILDIFGQHAHTAEGKLQVELAQYEYLYPRLTRAWTHLARQAGGSSGRSGSRVGVGLRGPGEMQLEVDRRRIQKRMTVIKNKLEKVCQHRKQYRQYRKKNQLPIIALVGYTNAGKSTLINQITNANVLVADQLFATLDPTTRRVVLPGGNPALITDTVGFIQKLPPQLIVSFRATLEEISEADLLIHVVDITHPSARLQYHVVLETLNEIGVKDIPIITVLNKIDQNQHWHETIRTTPEFLEGLAISALTGEGVDELLMRITQELFESFTTVTVNLPYKEGFLISMFHQNGNLLKVEHGTEGVILKGDLPKRLIPKYTPFLINK